MKESEEMISSDQMKTNSTQKSIPQRQQPKKKKKEGMARSREGMEFKGESLVGSEKWSVRGPERNLSLLKTMNIHCQLKQAHTPSLCDGGILSDEILSGVEYYSEHPLL